LRNIPPKQLYAFSDSARLRAHRSVKWRYVARCL
jgi:hypothetical protein